MKRNFNSVLNNLDGEPFKDEKGAELTLRRVSLDALGATMEGDQHLSGEDKVKLYHLGTRIAEGFKKNEPVELDDKDITTLKTRIGKAWGVFVVGPAFDILNADYVAEAAEAAPE